MGASTPSSSGPDHASAKKCSRLFVSQTQYRSTDARAAGAPCSWERDACCTASSFLIDTRPSSKAYVARIATCLADSREALRAFVAGIEVAGTSDLAVGGRKFSGNSQQRKRAHLLHHGSILYAFDITRISRYLPIPPRQPTYRSGRDHSDFLTNLPTPASALKQRIQSAWNANVPVQTWPSDAVKQLVQDKYGRAEWIRRL